MFLPVFVQVCACSIDILHDYRFIVYCVLSPLGAVACLAIYQLILYPRYLSALRSIPGPPLGCILSGQYPTILEGEAGIPQRQWVKDYGPVVRVVGPIGIERLIFTNAGALHKILISDWVEYYRPYPMRDFLGLVAGYGVLTAATAHDHKQFRRIMNPAFSIPNLVAQTDLYYNSINRLLDVFQKEVECSGKPEVGKVIHVYEWMSKATLDIICETAFGYTADSLRNPHNELAVAYEKLTSLQSGPDLTILLAILATPGAARLLTSDWAFRHRELLSKVFRMYRSLSLLYGCPPRTEFLKTIIESMHDIKTISARLLKEKIQDSLVTGLDKRDAMNLFLRARKSDAEYPTEGYIMSDADIVQQMLTFLGAGHETTASGLTWTLWLLANDTESQAKLRQEVSPLFAEPNARPDYRRLKDMQWLDCVVMESLRVLPPVPMTCRFSGKTDYIDGVLVPKGTLLYIPIRVVNTWKEIWGEDAEEFKPSRWLNLPPNYDPNTSFLSFLSGPRACIGRTMAIMEMKAILAALIARFEFEPSFVGQTIKPTAAITMKPKDGLPLRVCPVKG